MHRCAYWAAWEQFKIFFNFPFVHTGVSSVGGIMFGLPHLTSRQWATVVVIAFADFASAVCVSLQAPFYPLEVIEYIE